MLKNALTVFAAMAGLLLTACGSSEEFEYDETDIKAAVVGDWSGSMTFEGREPTNFTLVIEQKPPAANPACGSRTFNHTQCIDTSSMGLSATLTTEDGLYQDVKLDGSFMVYGLTFGDGDLDLQGAEVGMHTHYADGGFGQGNASSGDMQGTFTMSR